ncbi:MAG: hypothetical protein AAGJ81_04690 [Verrucomicrobiota bacterium]
MIRKDRILRTLRSGSILLGLSVILAGCFGRGDSPESAEPEPLGINSAGLQFNPNVRIGEVIWLNERQDFAVVRMDAPRPAFEPAFLLALDPTGTQLNGVLIGGGEIEGRSFGARVVEGSIPLNAEVRIPGPEWTEYLFNRYNQAERLPPQ